eukprot:SAG11_NODE_7581_length_1126_cov_0.927945_2_plen_73_part_00
MQISGEIAEGVAIADCTFKRVDGNAIMLSAYNRNASIVRNEFIFVGDNAIASWGAIALIAIQNASLLDRWEL